MASFLSLSLPKLNLIKASSATTTNISTTPTLTTPESLNEKFGRKGIKFLESNNIPIVELTVRNGSSLSLRLPDAHVTSYKPKVYWKDDGFEEVLYTIPPTETGPYKAKGGIGLVLNEVLQPGAKELLPSTLEWTLNDVDSDAIDALQVELSCNNKFFDMTYVVTLYPVSMATAVIVKNKSPKPVTLTNAILSHFRFKRRGGAAIQGLRTCSYCSLPPLASPFQILTPAEAMKSEPHRFISFGAEPEVKPGTWTQQGVPITLLENKMSRVYAAPPKERSKAFYNTAPSKYETIDQVRMVYIVDPTFPFAVVVVLRSLILQRIPINKTDATSMQLHSGHTYIKNLDIAALIAGRELFFRVIKMGFEDIYVSSPGSMSDKYGKDYFVCTGPASILVPVTVNPGEEWRGAQVIEHDNLS